jgi:hypothetical protein
VVIGSATLKGKRKKERKKERKKGAFYLSWHLEILRE